MPKKKNEFDEFSSLLNKVLQVPHDEIKAKLEAEKKAKKKKKSKRPSRATEN